VEADEETGEENEELVGAWEGGEVHTLHQMYCSAVGEPGGVVEHCRAKHCLATPLHRILD